MPRIRPATLDDADGICHFMHAHMNSEIAADTWRRLFTYRWHPSPPDLGFIVVDDGEIGGYMGTIYHQRRIKGELQTFCNLSSWFIAKPFRGQGLGRESLAQALEQRHRYHHSVLSAARNTARIFTTLQYPLLETHRYVLKPEVGGEWLEVLESPDEFRAQLGDVDTRILDDHLAYGCRHLYFSAAGSRSTYVIVKDFRRRRGGWRSEILYASDYGVLTEKAGFVAHHIVRDASSLVTIDARFMSFPPRAAVLEPLPTPRYCFSDRVPRTRYAGIYSEAVLLDYEI